MTIKSDITYGAQAKESILRGIKKVSGPVGSTLGPKGLGVAVAYCNERGIWGRIIMRDGVTVARSISLEDENENMGAQFVIDATRKQVDAVGDGTTVVTLLTDSIFEEINVLVAAGHNPRVLQKGVEKAVEKMIREIEKLAIPIKTLEQKKQIATVSAQDEVLGNIIAQAFEKMGVDGLILPEESTASATTIDEQKGFQIDKGWADANFMTNPDRGEATIEKPYVLLADGLINDLEPIKGLLEDCHKNHRKLVFIAPQFGLNAAGAMIANKMSGAIPCLLIEAPGFGQNQKDILQDIAIFTKATFFSDYTGRQFESATVADLGTCEYIKSTKNDSIIAGGSGDKKDIELRIAEIRQSIKTANETGNLDFDVDKLKERLARLTSGVSVIRVGGTTEVEMKEHMERVKDSIAATRAAIRSGIVPGGEVIYLTVREKLDTKDVAENIVYKALYRPFKTLLDNAAMNHGEWYQKLKHSKQTSGVDVIKEEIVDMVAEGNIYKAEVSIEALKNSVSTAVAESTVGTIIIQKDIDKK